VIILQRNKEGAKGKNTFKILNELIRKMPNKNEEEEKGDVQKKIPKRRREREIIL